MHIFENDKAGLMFKRANETKLTNGEELSSMCVLICGFLVCGDRS